MRVSTRLMLALVVVTGSFMGVLLALRHWQNQNVQVVLQDRCEAVSRFSDKAVGLLGKPLQTEAADYSVWTELVDFVKSGDPHWAEENLLASLKTFDTDSIWVYRTDATPVYFGTGLADKGFGDLLPLKGLAERLFAQSRLAHFFFRIPAGLMEVCGTTIHPSEDIDRKTPSVGYFFVGRLWDQAYLDRFSGLLDGTATLVEVNDSVTVQAGTTLEGNALVFRHPLNAWSGAPLGLLEVRSVSPLIDRFVSNTNWGLAVAGCFCLSLLALFAGLLMRWVTIPLRMLSGALVVGDGTPLGALEKSRSEYGNIARLVTEHFSQSQALLREIAERRQAEAALHRKETDLSSLLDALHESVFLMDRDGVILAANETFAARLGLTVEACLGKSVYSLVPDELAEKRRKIIDRVLRTRQPFTFEDVRDGRRMSHNAYPILSADGAVDRIVVYAMDFTEREQAENALRESDERFSSAFAHAATGMALVSLEGRWLRVNSAVCEILGYTEDELCATTFQEVTVPEDLDTDLAQMRRLLAGEIASYHLEKRYCHKRGHVVWAMLSVSLVRDPRGEPAYFIAQIQNITEHRQALEALRESRQQLQIALESGFDAFYLLRCVRNGAGETEDFEIMEVSARGAQLVSRTREQLIGRKLCELFPFHKTEGYFEKYRAVAEGGPSFEEDVFVPAHPENGVTEDLWLHHNVVPAGDGIAITSSVITDRKRAEEALRERENLLNKLFDILPVGLWFADAKGNILRGNPAGRRIWGAEHLVGIEDYGVFHGRRLPSGLEIAPDDWAMAHTVNEGVTILNEELEIDAFDGKKRTILNYSAPVLDDNGVVEAAVVVNLDITEYKRLEEQLRQAQKMDAVGQLAGGVAHDFNNLLQVILGNVGLVQRMQAPGAPTWDEIEEVRRAAERAAELTQQLLAFSRRQTIQPAHVDLNELIQGLLKMLRRLIGERIELCFIPGEALETVHVDSGQIEQALMNLSVNARDAMPRGGKLTLRTENALMDAAFCRENPWAVEGHYVLITVTDTGQGMDDTMRTRIFEPFFTTKEVGQGTGLGLATVYGIVKQHNGLVHVDSAPQKGTVFRVFLPVAKRPGQHLESPEKQPVCGGKETILVAEDEPPVLNLIASLLRTVGYNVLTARDGAEAVRVFEEHAGGVELAVLDMVMPGLSGRDVMERIKAAGAHTRFLFSSGYSASSIHKDFAVDDGLHLIRKPYRREDLLRAVRQILDAPAADAAHEGAPAGEATD